MNRKRTRIKTYEVILCVIVLVIIAAGLMMPKTGQLVLADEFCDAAARWIVCICVIVRILRNRTSVSASMKAYRAAVMAVCVVIGICFSKNLCMDLAAGLQSVTLSDIQVSTSQGHTGIFSHHYYLTGSDRGGERIRVEISGQDYERLETAGSVLIEYYPNTKRVVKLLPV